jgi:hypothetical protein
MLDLRTGTVIDWLQLVRPVDAWPPLVRPIEATPHAEALLIDLGEQLERGSDEDPASLAAKLQHRELVPEFQQFLAQLGAARLLRILHWLNERGIPDNFAIIAALLAGDTPSARTIRATIAAIGRSATINRLFAPERLTELQIAAEAALKEPS